MTDSKACYVSMEMTDCDVIDREVIIIDIEIL